MRRFIFLLSAMTWLPFASQAETKETPAQTSEILYPAPLVSLPSNDVFSPYSFVVNKATRTLSVYYWDGQELKLFAEHPSDFGKKSGPKVKENDYRTPEGIYFLTAEKTQPEIPFDLYGNLAFTTDYPNVFDHRDAKTGSGIWLHAVPDTVPLTRGSRGCVVVRNDVIKELKKCVKVGQTPIVIADEITYLTKEQYQAQQKKFLETFEEWRNAWETHDVDTYIKFYDETFQNDQMNFKQWYRFKKKLKSIYSYIKVHLSQPLILLSRNQIVIRAIQSYDSDKHHDYGEKTIHARLGEDGRFKIIREDWRPLPEPKTAAQAN
jgi:murein L,D-transpeptidase YafK